MRTMLTTPRRDLLSSMFEDFFEDMWTRPTWAPLNLTTEVPAVARGRMDVVDKGHAYAVTVDMPGVKKEDIDVSIEGARVMITAESVYETPVKEGEKILHSERFAARYARSFELPTEVTETGADAVFDNGVLTLTLPKRADVLGKKLLVH